MKTHGKGHALTSTVACLAGVAAFLAGCMSTAGDIKVYSLDKPRYRYGIEFQIPPPPKGWLLPRYSDLRDWGTLWSPFDVSVGYSRKDRHYPVGFWVLFLRRDKSLPNDPWIEDAVNWIKHKPGSGWKDEDIDFRMRNGGKWGRECVFFELERHWKNVGNLGEIGREFGLLFLHPDDDEVIVVFRFADRFAPRIGEQPDRRVETLAERVYDSVRFVPLTTKEREQLRAAKWIVPEVW